MKGKRTIALLCAAAMVLALTACGSGTWSGQTLTGQVTEIDGSTVTLQLGELTEGGAPGAQTDQSDTDTQTDQTGQAPSDGQTPPDRPDGGDGTDGETPPEKPEGQEPGTDGGTPPEKPDATAPSDDGTASENGAAPSDDGTAGGSDEAPGTPPDGAPSGGTGGFTAGDETATLDFSSAAITKDGEDVGLDDIAVGDVLTCTVGDGDTVTSAELLSVGSGFGGGAFTQGDSAYTISEDGTYTGVTYSSTGDDENALRVDGAVVTLDGVTVDKSAGATSNTENGDFYGVNAALLATNGATVTIRDAVVTSSAQNGNGVFSYGTGTTVDIADSTITTTADNSGGIQTTGGGTTNARGLTVDTSGDSSAAIRSDRGGGTVTVDGGTYATHGYDSPAVYSTADITVRDAVLTAERSEALVVEGENSITLEDCTVTGDMSATNGSSSDENVHSVMIYQSMSGDADVGTSVLSMTGGSLTGRSGDLFYVTNTHCRMTLSGVALTNEDADGCLLRVMGNSASHGWGTAGRNGAQVELTADGQTLEGDIVVDTISTLTMTLQNRSSFTGTISIVENAEGGTAVSDNAVVTVESGCTWTLTGDCTLTSLTNHGTIDFNGHTITLADGTVLS